MDPVEVPCRSSKHRSNNMKSTDDSMTIISSAWQHICKFIRRVNYACMQSLKKLTILTKTSTVLFLLLLYSSDLFVLICIMNVPYFARNVYGKWFCFCCEDIGEGNTFFRSWQDSFHSALCLNVIIK